jgi:hypothetical protein
MREGVPGQVAQEHTTTRNPGSADLGRFICDGLTAYLVIAIKHSNTVT